MYALVSSPEEEDELEEDLEDLTVIASTRYVSRGGSAGRNNATLEGYTRESPDDAFLVLFCMHQPSFWQLVELALRDINFVGCDIVVVVVVCDIVVCDVTLWRTTCVLVPRPAHLTLDIFFFI